MRIENIKVEYTENDAVLSADFRYGKNKTRNVYFSIDKKYSNFLCTDATIFMPIGLVLAMKLGEDLYIEGSVSKKLFENSERIQKVLIVWNVGLKKIKVEVEKIITDNVETKNIGSFFSGGVDSFYTFLKKQNTVNNIDYFILVHGFDIYLDDIDRFEQVKDNTMSIGRNQNVEVLAIKTNLRELTDNILEWGFSHGAALASVCLLLRKGLKKIFIPSTYSFGTLHPWGSHPDLDPLWSTESLELIHDAADISRVKKTIFISSSAEVLKYLRVCWKNVKGKYNCSACPKCLRTMIDLNITGALEKSETFERSVNINLVRKLPVDESLKFFWQQTLDELIKRNINKEYQDAIKHALNKKQEMSYYQKLRYNIHYLDAIYNRGRLNRFLSSRGIIH